MTVTIRQADPHEPGATKLLQSSHALMQSLFDQDHNHYLEIDELCVPEITFFLAEDDGISLGCVALANKGDYGEIKSMFVSDMARGAGVGALLINRLEDHGRAIGLDLIRLETGNTLYAAHRLYARHGYLICEAFGDYKPSPVSIFMEKSLSSTA